MTTLKITLVRRSMLTQVQEGLVAFSLDDAQWVIASKTVGGWVGRSLSELCTAGLIVLARKEGKGFTPARLTDAGRDALTV